MGSEMCIRDSVWMPRGEQERLVGQNVGAESCTHRVLGRGAEARASCAMQRTAATAISAASPTGAAVGVVEVDSGAGHFGLERNVTPKVLLVGCW